MSASSPRILVTCHANADFDSFAAMLAAHFLYPGSLLLFPGTQERGLQKVVASLDAKRYHLTESADIPWDEITHLVLVDTRQRERVRHVSTLLDREGVTVEVWDHHPASSEDVPAQTSHVETVGSVTALLVRELRQRGIVLEAVDATLLGLGIYGDTGSFTYSSTTPLDFESSAWLLTQGMDVNAINEMAAHELTSLHVRALNSLLESARVYHINNEPVVIAEASMEHYLGDFAYLAHRLMEMEKFTVLFAVGRMEDRVQVVARSRSDAINVGRICAELGGGGHAYAASASIRNLTLNEVHDAIVRNLHMQAGPEKTASDYMSSPAVGIESDRSMREADTLMMHFGLKAVPVFKPGTRHCIGILDAQTASRATSHKLGDRPVDDYMRRNIKSLAPDAPLRDISSIIVGGRQRLVPIVDKELVVGVVTRTDLINVMTSEPGQVLDYQENNSRERNVAKLLRDRLPARVRHLLELAGRLGQRLNMPVYVVGGFVRDLLLDRPNHDVDFVVEGEGVAFARALAAELGGRVREHRKFLTSMVIYHDEDGLEQRIDVATARLEYYESPAALPTVELSSIKMDLFRRDFTINALAIRLDCTPYGQLVDFFGGQRDIKEGVLRMLHTLSFVEDPTRSLRAVRFEQRYGFHIGPSAEKLIKNLLSLHMLDKLSGKRIFNEYTHICDEDDPAACFERLDGLGLLRALGPSLTLTPSKRQILQQVRSMLNWYRLLYFDESVENWLIYFLALGHRLNYAEVSANFAALGLPEGRKQEILQQRESMRHVQPKLARWQKAFEAGTGRISELYLLLEKFSLEFLLYIMAGVEDSGLQKNLSRYITQWRREKPDIDGRDLRDMGIAPGPLFGRILRAVLVGKLDGETPDADSQRRLALDMARQEGVFPK